MPALPLSVTFGASGDYALWAEEGWHTDDGDAPYTWASQLASLRIPLTKHRDDVEIIIDVIPVLTSGRSQKVFVYINGQFVYFWNVRHSGEYRGRFDSRCLIAGINKITFVMPDAVCPKEDGLGADERTLSVAFRSIRLEHVVS